MDRNYCFRRKRHSYAACDAALAASSSIMKMEAEKLATKKMLVCARTVKN